MQTENEKSNLSLSTNAEYEDRKNKIVEVFTRECNKLGRNPTYSELKDSGITKKKIEYYFGFGKDRLYSSIAGLENAEPVSTETKVELENQKDFAEEKKQFIIDSYLSIIDKNKRLPSMQDFVEYGITKSIISSSFGNLSKLHDYIEIEHADKIKDSFTTLQSILSKDGLLNDTYVGKRYIITTAVADFAVHRGFIESIKTYSREKDAQIVILPCESVSNSFEKRSAIFDKEFEDPIYNFITRDVDLNENIFLCSIQVSAKQIKSTTGLARLGKRGGSYIFASPKQFLDYKPSGNGRGKNYTIMTTGSCTTPNYFSTDTFVSKRLAYIADHDHMLGAVIVEVEDEKNFHFRQIQADEDGSFIDLGVKYNPDSTTETVPMNIVLGDLHGVNCDVEALNSFVEDFKEFDIENLFIHDAFDGESISHHIETIYERHERVKGNKQVLKNELYKTYRLLRKIHESLDIYGKSYLVKSNHDEFLTRYLKSGRYVHDPENHYISLKIAVDMLDGMDDLKSGFIHSVDHAEEDVMFILDNLVFLDRKTGLKIADVEMAEHGDLGTNGGKPSLGGLEEVFGHCVIGHSHTPAIQRGVFRVGTMSKLDLNYNRGSSSWAHTNCIIYANGQRQLVNFVNGKYYM